MDITSPPPRVLCIMSPRRLVFSTQENALCTTADYAMINNQGYQPPLMHTVFTLKDSLDSTDASIPDSNNQILNMPRLMANANRKNFDNVDKQGNAQMYTLGIKPQACSGSLNVIASTAIDNYVVKRAVKKWHEARKRMFRRLGFSLKDLGPYGATLRPYFSHDHHDGTVPEVAIQTSIGSEVGQIYPVVPDYCEWTYSSAAVSTPMEDSAAISESNFYVTDLVDTYQWTLLGASVQESDEADDPDESSGATDQDSWVTVGIVESWLDSFKLRQQAIVSTTNDTAEADNPLSQLWADSQSSEEVMEIIEDIQKENQPWDRADVTYYSPVTRSCWATGNQPGYMVVEAPCGLLELDLVGHNTDGDHTAEIVEVEIEVLGIRDM